MIKALWITAAIMMLLCAGGNGGARDAVYYEFTDADGVEHRHELKANKSRDNAVYVTRPDGSRLSSIEYFFKERDDFYYERADGTSRAHTLNDIGIITFNSENQEAETGIVCIRKWRD